MEENQNTVTDEQGSLHTSPLGYPLPEPKKRSRIALLVLITSGLFWIPFIWIQILIGYLAYQAEHGMAGTEYVSLFLLPIILLNMLVGIVYFVLLIVFVRSKPPNQPSKKQRTASIIIIVLLAAYPVLTTLWQAFTPNDIKKFDKSEYYKSQMLSDNEVSAFIKDCKVESIDAYHDDNANLVFVDYGQKGKSGIDPDKVQKFRQELADVKNDCEKATAESKGR